MAGAGPPEPEPEQLRGHLIAGIDQNTAEWHRERLGADRAAITASSLINVQNVSFMRKFAWYDDLAGFVRKRRAIMEANPAPVPPVGWDMKDYPPAHGHFYEDRAADAFAQVWRLSDTRPFFESDRVLRFFEHMGTLRAELSAAALDWEAGGLWEHPTLPWLRASPDRVLHLDGKLYILEIKCPISSAALGSSTACGRYWAQLQLQLFVTKADAAFLFIYHVPTQRVTLVKIAAIAREEFETRILPVLARVHAALVDPEHVTLDYTASFILRPRAGEYVPLVEGLAVPALFTAGEMDSNYEAVRALWLSLPTVATSDKAPELMPTHEASTCARPNCFVRGAYVPCDVCTTAVYCSHSCRRHDANKHAKANPDTHAAVGGD